MSFRLTREQCLEEAYYQLRNLNDIETVLEKQAGTAAAFAWIELAKQLEGHPINVIQ